MSLKIKIPNEERLNIRRLKTNLQNITDHRLPNYINAMLSSYNYKFRSKYELFNQLKTDFKRINKRKIKLRILLSLTHNYLGLKFIQKSDNLKHKKEHFTKALLNDLKFLNFKKKNINIKNCEEDINKLFSKINLI